MLLWEACVPDAVMKSGKVCPIAWTLHRLVATKIAGQLVVTDMAE